MTSAAPRMRVVAWRVQPVIMADDGQNLTPVPVSPLDIPASAWEQWKAGGDDASLAQLRAQVETPPPPPTEPQED